MLNPKYLLLVVILVLSAIQVRADQLDSDGVLRDSVGEITGMWWTDALKACPAGMHLPTARDQAKASQALGAKGILEMNQISGKVPDGYRLISAINPDGTKDRFYFNSHGYVHPTGGLGFSLFWSSSLNSDYAHAEAYVLDGYTGAVVVDTFGDGNGRVHCILNH